ncbi:MAG: coproporphyrinogen III oxidase family protein [Campylobacteraceae bacterium]|nr:coproporphyrinogen III oxidase family protein [Campylobacteraceae bacterium]
MGVYIESKVVKLFSRFINFYTNKHLHIGEKSSGLPAKKSDKKPLLYIHVPFCIMFCPYCSFHKFIFSKERADKYFDYLKLELLHIKSLGYNFDRLVIGGGSPLLCEDQVIKTVEFAKNLFSIHYVSCESDPLHISLYNITKLKGVIDRLSIGVQTFDDKLLKSLGRYDKFGSGQEIFERVENILGVLPATSVDIIFNFPLQTEKELMHDIEMLKKLSAEQTSVYPLMSSAVTKNSIKAKLGVFNIKNERRYFDIVKRSLQEIYPVRYGWSFMKKQMGWIDEYTIDKSEYVGAGAGAFSFLDNSLYINEFSLDGYIKRVNKQGSSTLYKKSFSKKSILYYNILTGLYGGGIKKDEFGKLFWELAMLKFIKAVKEKAGQIVTTDFGDYLFMVAMKEFYIGMDRIRAKGREGTLDI